MTQYVRGGTVGRTGAAAQWGVRDLRRRPPVFNPRGIYEIKIFPDDEEVVVPDEYFEWMIPEDLGGFVLDAVEAFVSTTGAAITVQIENERQAGGTVSMLSTVCTIDSGERNSVTATQAVVNAANDEVLHGDHLRVVNSAGAGAMGLGVIVRLVKPTAP